MENDNQENSLNKKATLQKINFESDVIELKLQSYQNILNKDYHKSQSSYEQYLNLSENSSDNFIKCDALYCFGMSNYLNGEFEEALKYLEIAYENIESLPKIKKNKILEIKIICNLCLVSLSLSNFSNTNDYCNLIIETIRTETDKKFQKEALKQVMKIFFNTDSLNNYFTSNINRYNINERLLINNDNNKNNEEFRIKITSKIIYYFHKYLRDDDIDSWIQCLNEECENFKIINESNGFLISVFNMYLCMYTKNPNITEKAKMKIFNVCKCLINSKNEKDIKPLETLLQECREKMRQATLVYKKLLNIEIEIETLNTSSSGFRRKDSVIEPNKANANVITKIFLSHARNYLLDLIDEGKINGVPFKSEQMLNQIEISLDLIKNNKVDLVDLNVLDFDIDLAVAMKAMFENLLFIRYKFIVEKYFRKLMRLTFGYENLASKLIKKQKRFEAFSTRKFLDICEGK